MNPHGMSLPSRVILAALGHLPQPPVDLPQIALDLGVSAMLTATKVAGYVDMTTGGPVVHVGEARTQHRAHFVLAHELAHVMLHSEQVSESLGRGRVLQAILAEEERWADRVAGTLLAPDDVLAQLSRQPLAWRTLSSMAARLEVSTTLLVTRLSMTGIPASIIRLGPARRGWIVSSRIAVPSVLDGRLTVSEDSQRSLAAVTGRPTPFTLEVRKTDRRVVLVEGAARRINGDVAVLFGGSRDLTVLDPCSAAGSASGSAEKAGRSGWPSIEQDTGLTAELGEALSTGPPADNGIN